MGHKLFCDEHEEIKSCTKGAITWGDMVKIISIVVVVTSSITGFLYFAINKAEARGIKREDKIEESSIVRDKEIANEIKRDREQYIIPLVKNVSRLCIKFGIEEK